MKHYFFFMLMVVSGPIYAQILSVSDSITGAPVELVTIVSEQPRVFTVTNNMGQADISAFKGSKLIQIRILGYKTKITSFDKLESAGFKILLQPEALSLDALVISGTRWNQESDNIPSKISSIPRAAVLLQNPQTAADLLSVSGSVYVQKSQQGGGSPMIRGFSANRLLYTVDGIRMNNAIFRSGNLQNVINIDPFSVGNTEILFGPGSVIYGSDAIGGVMNFNTLTPTLSIDSTPDVSGEAIFRYSSANNERTGHFHVITGWKKFSMVTSISSWDFDHLRQGRHGPTDYIKPFHVQRIDDTDRVIWQDDPLLQVPTGYQQMNILQKFRYKPSDHLNLVYGFYFSETSSYGRYDRHNRMRNGLPRYGEWNYGPQRWIMNNLTISHSKENFVYDEVSLRLAWQEFDESRIDRAFNDNLRFDQKEHVDALSSNLDFIKGTGTRNKVFYGMEHVVNLVESTGSIINISNGSSLKGPSRYPEASWQSAAIYINDQFEISEWLTLQAGARYNHFLLDADFDTTFYPFPFTEAHVNSGSVTGSAGAVIRPTDKWIINVNAGSAFRAPNVDDIGKVFDSSPGAVTVPNPDLREETAYNIDLGTAWVIGDWMKIEVTGFYTFLNNAMVRRDFLLNGEDTLVYNGVPSRIEAIQNAATAKVYGVHGGIEIMLPGGFSFSGDVNYQQGEEELDDGSISPSRHAAPLFGVVRLRYQHNKLRIQLYSHFQGTRRFEKLAVEERDKDEIYASDAQGRNYSPGWFTLNFKSSYHLTKWFSVNAGLENLMDIRYRPYSSGISAPGRNFIISARATF